MSRSALASKAREQKHAGRMGPPSRELSPLSAVPGTYADLLALQQSAGNRAVHGLVTGGIPPVVQSVINSVGQPLEPGLRTQMEARFGQDFSQVRIHADGRAAESAAAFGARAFTMGRDVVFGEGRYAPNSVEGRRLLGHELAHVVQQTRRFGDSIAPLAIAEREAHQASIKSEAGGMVRIERAATGLQCAPLSRESIDRTFNAWLRVYKGDVDKALAKTRERIGHPLPKTYIPPPLRASQKTHPDNPEVRNFLLRVEYAEASVLNWLSRQSAKNIEQWVNSLQVIYEQEFESGRFSLAAKARRLSSRIYPLLEDARRRQQAIAAQEDIDRMPKIDVDYDWVRRQQLNRQYETLGLVASNPISGLFVLARRTQTDDPEALAQAAEAGVALSGLLSSMAGMGLSRPRAGSKSSSGTPPLGEMPPPPEHVAEFRPTPLFGEFRGRLNPEPRGGAHPQLTPNSGAVLQLPPGRRMPSIPSRGKRGHGQSWGELAERPVQIEHDPGAVLLTPSYPGFDWFFPTKGVRLITSYVKEKVGSRTVFVMQQEVSGGYWTQLKMVEKAEPSHIRSKVEEGLRKAAWALDGLKSPTKQRYGADNLYRRVVIRDPPEKITILMKLTMKIDDVRFRELSSAALEALKNSGYTADLPPVEVVIAGPR